MESINRILGQKSKRQVRLGVLLASTAIIIATSLLAYNRITYDFPLAVGNAGQSALGPPTSAGVGIAYAMIVVGMILGLGAVLSIFGSLRNVSSRISTVVRESLPTSSDSEPQEKDEWEHVSAKNERKATDDDILNALWRSKDEKSAAPTE